MENEKKTSDERYDGGKIPNQKELEKELSDYLSKKYGNRVKIISPLVFPRSDEETIDEEGRGGESEGSPMFDMLPEELEAYLDSFVVKQRQAKAILATKICTHFNRIKHSAKTRKKREQPVSG